jgi:XTP/dITP diphosphohydrolase
LPRFRLLVATTNPGKTREIALILSDLPVELTSLDALATDPGEPEETGDTFAANARLKAEYYAERSGLPTVAEDSGLAIDALGGRPGIHSARYPGITYPDKFANLYAELGSHPKPWLASYVCSLCFVDQAQGRRPQAQAGVEHGAQPGALGPGPWAYSCEATVEGEISPKPIGERGFGYDPIFFYPPYGTTLGNVDDDLKLTVAHRGRAFRQFRAWLGRRLGAAAIGDR